jgi:hypothetical protein
MNRPHSALPALSLPRHRSKHCGAGIVRQLRIFGHKAALRTARCLHLSPDNARRIRLMPRRAAVSSYRPVKPSTTWMRSLRVASSITPRGLIDAEMTRARKCSALSLLSVKSASLLPFAARAFHRRRSQNRHEALAAEHDMGMLEARECQPEVVEPRPGGCSWRKITSRLGPLRARHRAMRRSKVRRTPRAIPNGNITDEATDARWEHSSMRQHGLSP